MQPCTPTTITVLHADHVAALCTRDRVFLARGVAAMPVGHPDRVFVETKCLVARAYLDDDLVGTYDDHECDRAARILLGLAEPPVADLPPLRDVAPAPHAGDEPRHRLRRRWPRPRRTDRRGPA